MYGSGAMAGQIRAVSMVTALFPHPVKPEPNKLATQFWYLPPLNHVWGARITSLELSVTFWLARIANQIFSAEKAHLDENVQ